MRMDKWLYYARIYKTRKKSSKACVEGDVMVNKLPATPKGKKIKEIEVTISVANNNHNQK